MTGARAQFGRRPTVAPAVVQPPAAEAQVAGRASARRRVPAGRQGHRGGVAFPALALAVVALTWLDAGVLRAEDAVAEGHVPPVVHDAEIVAWPPRLGEAVSATDGVAEPDDTAPTDETESEQEDEA